MITRIDMSLDVESPEQVADVLRRAAEKFFEDSYELDAAWQDETAGNPWRFIARRLERAANAIEERI